MMQVYHNVASSQWITATGGKLVSTVLMGPMKHMEVPVEHGIAFTTLALHCKG